MTRMMTMKKTEISLNLESVPLSLRQNMVNSKIYDSSCSENARTYFIKGKEEFYLKISKAGSLERESKMYGFLSNLKVSPKVIAYETQVGNDYLLTEAIRGEDGTFEIHLGNPQKLAVVLGENLRMLHELPIDGCPFKNRTAEMVNEIEMNELNHSLINNLMIHDKSDVIIHGDYCLPNIIMDKFLFKGFIDLGYGGIGDRHYDIYWGLWTLKYNLKTENFNDLFLDAYGREVIDDERMNLFSYFIESIQK